MLSKNSWRCFPYSCALAWCICLSSRIIIAARILNCLIAFKDCRVQFFCKVRGICWIECLRCVCWIQGSCVRWIRGSCTRWIRGNCATICLVTSCRIKTTSTNRKRTNKFFNSHIQVRIQYRSKWINNLDGNLVNSTTFFVSIKFKLRIGGIITQKCASSSKFDKYTLNFIILLISKGRQLPWSCNARLKCLLR